MFKHLSEVEGVKAISPVAKTMEKFVMFNVKFDDCKWSLDFKDSFNFLSTSLDRLVKNLKAAADKRQDIDGYFKHTRTYFQKNWGHVPDKAFKLLLQKGIFPYRWFDSLEKLNERKLPDRVHWKNDLTGEDISDKDWAFVNKVWHTFKMKTFRQFHDLYMESDVMLLADVIERFRSDSLKNYGLDPAHFATAPGLSWHACLKMTKIRLDVIRDPDMNIFIDKSGPGGMSEARTPYLRANNPKVGGYNPDLVKTWMLLLDCNNQ